MEKQKEKKVMRILRKNGNIDVILYKKKGSNNEYCEKILEENVKIYLFVGKKDGKEFSFPLIPGENFQWKEETICGKKTMSPQKRRKNKETKKWESWTEIRNPKESIQEGFAFKTIDDRGEVHYLSKNDSSISGRILKGFAYTDFNGNIHYGVYAD